MRRFLSANRLVSIGCLVIAAAFGAGTLALPEPNAFQQVSAKVWPSILVAALILAAVLVWLTEQPERPKGEVEEDFEVDERPGSAAIATVVGLFLSLLQLCTSLVSGRQALSSWSPSPCSRANEKIGCGRDFAHS